MRCFVGVVSMVAALLALPMSVGAQAGEEPVPKVELAIHTQHRLPPQLMLRASYYLYLDADERGRSPLERWHPEAFVDPVSGVPLAVPEDPQVPTAPLSEEQERKRRRRIGIGVGVSVAAVVILAVVGGVAAARLRDL